MRTGNINAPRPSDRRRPNRRATTATIALAAAAALPAVPALAQTTASWLNPVTGEWTDPRKWSTNPAFPNNGSPTAADAYDVLIAAPASGTSTYAVHFDGTNVASGLITVNSVTLNAPAATLSLNSGTLSVGGNLILNGGAVDLEGGTLRNATVSGTGGLFIPRHGLLDGVTFLRGAAVSSNQLQGGDTLRVQNGLTLGAGTTLAIDYGDAYMAGAGIYFQGDQTLAGNGTLSFTGSRKVKWGASGGTLVVAPGVTVRGTADMDYNTGGVENRGTIVADGAFFIEDEGLAGTGFVNRGVVSSAVGGDLLITGAFDNSAGTIRADGGIVTFNGGTNGYTAHQLGSLYASGGGTVQLSGRIDNTGATLTAASADNGRFVLYGVTVQGGTMRAAAGGGGAGFTVERVAHLSGVTLAGGKLTVLPLNDYSGAVLTVHDLSLADGATISIANVIGYHSPASVETLGPETIRGDGQILFDGPNDGTFNMAGPLTLGPGVRLATGAAGGSIGNATAALTNLGTLSAATAGRTLFAANVVNQGVLEAVNGSALNVTGLANGGGTVRATTGAAVTISGTWTNAGGTARASGNSAVYVNAPGDFGTFLLGDSTVYLSASATTAQLHGVAMTNSAFVLNGSNGLLDNTAATLLVGAGNTFRLGGGGATLRGGTVTAELRSGTAAAGAIVVTGRNVADRVTFAADVTVTNGATLAVSNALSLDHATLHNAGTLLMTTPTATLDGTGQLVFDGATTLGKVLPRSGGTLTIGPNVAVVTGPTAAGTVGATTSFLVNHGLLSARTPGQTLYALAGPLALINDGVAESVNGGALLLQGLENLPGGLVTASGTGSVLLIGSWDNGAGGRISLTDNASLFLGGSFSPSNAGSITLGGSSRVVLAGTLNAAGATVAADAFGGRPVLLTYGAQVVGGTITPAADGSGWSNYPGAAVTVTLDGVNVAAPVSLTNGGTLTLAGAWNNAGGTLTVSGGASLNLGGTFTYDAIGTIHRAGGTVNLTGTLDLTGRVLQLDDTTASWNALGGTIAGGTVRTADAARLLLPNNTGALTLANGVTLDADLAVPFGRQLTVAGGLTLATSRTVSFAQGVFTFAGTAAQTLDGGGTLAFDSGTNPGNGLRNTSTARATIGPGVRVTAGFLSISGGTGGILNQGTIAAGTGGTIFLSHVTNQGTVALDAGTVLVSDLLVSTPLTLTGGSAGGRLGGVGTVRATVADGGTVAPGNFGIGTLSVDGPLTLTSGGHFAVELSGTASADLLKVTGDVDLSAADDYLDVSKLTTPALPFGTSYVVMTYGGALTGTFDHVTPGYLASYDTPGKVIITAVPEPAAGLAAGLATLLVTRRRRRPSGGSAGASMA